MGRARPPTATRLKVCSCDQGSPVHPDGDEPSLPSLPLLQVQNISLVDGETVTVETLGGVEPVALANESFLMRGQVIRGPTNQVVVRFQSPAPANPGTFLFHFQGENCNWGAGERDLPLGRGMWERVVWPEGLSLSHHQTILQLHNGTSGPAHSWGQLR